MNAIGMVDTLLWQTPSNSVGGLVLENISLVIANELSKTIVRIDDFIQFTVSLFINSEASFLCSISVINLEMSVFTCNFKNFYKPVRKQIILRRFLESLIWVDFVY